MSAPERITITHKGKSQTSLSAMGVFDVNTPFCEDYVRKDIADRSTETHNHEFAVIREMFENLPERYVDEAWAASRTTMRKHALIMKGYCDVLPFLYDDYDHAVRESARVKATLLKMHGYVIGSGRKSESGGYVVVYKIPHSQNKQSMGAKAFQESKSAVLEWCKMILEIDDDLNIAGTA